MAMMHTKRKALERRRRGAADQAHRLVALRTEIDGRVAKRSVIVGRYLQGAESGMGPAV